eukprot:TRINITY_DN17868_c0_g1_i4.p2 TRINITY_DN17868_c0_g1~~TRINITY_DN17868_c0_g1_i4.p2  ORF type:complete len:141 (+),score=10.30 TRINITY_DN17868_c0_g1_i4:252-674(+)
MSKHHNNLVRVQATRLVEPRSAPTEQVHPTLSISGLGPEIASTICCCLDRVFTLQILYAEPMPGAVIDLDNTVVLHLSLSTASHLAAVCSALRSGDLTNTNLSGSPWSSSAYSAANAIAPEPASAKDWGSRTPSSPSWCA